jgi:hypothetical protein
MFHISLNKRVRKIVRGLVPLFLVFIRFVLSPFAVQNKIFKSEKFSINFAKKKETLIPIQNKIQIILNSWQTVKRCHHQQNLNFSQINETNAMIQSIRKRCLTGHKSGLKKIRFVSWITNPNLKRFGSYRDHESSQFSKDSTCFHQSNESSRILSTMAQNESLKLEIRESESLSFGFANPNLKDSYRGFVSEKKIPKLLDLFCFGRIRIRIPHP